MAILCCVFFICRLQVDCPSSSSVCNHEVSESADTIQEPLDVVPVSFLEDIDNIKLILDQANKTHCLNELQSTVPVNKCCDAIFQKLKEFKQLSVAVNSKHDKTSWQQERQFRITASRCYSLFTYQKNDWDIKASKYFWPKGFTTK